MSDRGQFSSGPATPRRLFVAALRDPLTHFVIAGAALFAIYATLVPSQPAPPSDQMRIELTADDLRQIVQVWQAQGRGVPGSEELRTLAKKKAIQRILAREAVALGLDQSDEIIERRLAQKMDFLLADLSSLDEPDEAELRAWFAKNTERFAVAPRVSFKHLYFSQDKRGVDGARLAAQEQLGKLSGIGPSDARLYGIADRFMFRDYYGGRSPGEISKEFGPKFADKLFALKTGQWLGPIRSGYGWHLVWIDTLQPGHPAEFEAVRDAVRSAWLDERYRAIRDRAYDEMLSRYKIVMPDPATVKFSPATASARAD